MYVAILLSNTLAGTTTIVYAPSGGWSTYEAAAAWVANQQTPGNYLIVASFSPPTNPPSTPITPSTITPGQWVVVLLTFDISGNVVSYCYGAFGSQPLAQAWQANNIQPSNYSVAQVAQAQ
jgi:hypothetical protein